MANELSSHLNRLAKVSATKSPSTISQSQLLSAQEMTMERFLTGITYYRCHTQSELVALLHLLPSFLAARANKITATSSSSKAVKLIVLDSIAFLFRAEVQEIQSRNRILAEVLQLCNSLVFTYGIAFVVMNHVTTKIISAPSTSNSNNSNNKVMSLVPALGEQYSHHITNRLLLHYHHHHHNHNHNNTIYDSTSTMTMMMTMARYATLVKSPAFPPRSTLFTINQKGIRDVPIPIPIPPTGVISATNSNSNTLKRSRE